MAGEYREPWRVCEDEPEWAEDANHEYLLGTYTVLSRTREFDQAAMARAVLCVNALAGVPDATLAAPDEAAQLALSVLRGQPDWGLLDKLMELRTAADTAPAKCSACGGKGYVVERERWPGGDWTGHRPCPSCSPGGAA